MSKYIDAERLNMEWQTLKPFGVTDTMIENLKWIVYRQPTIEVSEDCIDRDLIINQLLNLMSVEKEHYEGMDKALKLIEHAPSVVPKDNGFKDGQKDMLMFLLEGMKNALEQARKERIEE